MKRTITVYGNVLRIKCPMQASNREDKKAWKLLQVIVMKNNVRNNNGHDFGEQKTFSSYESKILHNRRRSHNVGYIFCQKISKKSLKLKVFGPLVGQHRSPCFCLSLLLGLFLSLPYAGIVATMSLMSWSVEWHGATKRRISGDTVKVYLLLTS